MSGYTDRAMLSTIDRHIAELTKRIRQLEQRPFPKPGDITDLVDPNAGGGGGGGGGDGEYTPVTGQTWEFSTTGLYLGGDTYDDYGDVDMTVGSFPAPIQLSDPPEQHDLKIPLTSLDTNGGPEFSLPGPGYVLPDEPVGPLLVSGSCRLFFRCGLPSDPQEPQFGTTFMLGWRTGWNDPPHTALALSDVYGLEDFVHPEIPGDTWTPGESYVDLAFSGLTVSGVPDRPMALIVRFFYPGTSGSEESIEGWAVQSASLTVAGS